MGAKATTAGGERRGFFLFILVAASVMLRIPFLDAYDLVEYDGTYYINIARSLLDGVPSPSPFPVGYPLLIAPLIPIMDDVRAAQLVSFFASLGSLVVLYMLARSFLSRRGAMAVAVVLAATPLFIRYSLMTMSESAYVFWVLLALLMFQRKRNLAFGASAGMAAITRPEALVIFVVLMVVRWRDRRQILLAPLAFVAVFSINAGVQSFWSGRLVLLQKTENLGMSAQDWRLREAWVDFEGREDIENELAAQSTRARLLEEYVRRVPVDGRLLLRHLTIGALLLGLFGIYRGPKFLLAALVPIVAFPLFTPRSSARFVLPYIPVFILYAVIAIERLPSLWMRRTAAGLFAALVAVGIYMNFPLLREKVSEGYDSTREAAREFAAQVKHTERMADRKPYFAFYSGASFVRLPAAPYDVTVQYLFDEGVEYISLDNVTTPVERPQMVTLLYNKPLILGEFRYEQVFYRRTGEIIYRRLPAGEPSRATHITAPDGMIRMSPAWSPDGRRIAYREATEGGEGRIVVVSPSGEDRQPAVTEKSVQDAIAWAPDAPPRIAFANKVEETMSIYVYELESGTLERITDDGGEDRSPSWSPDGRSIVFSSNRSEQRDIWRVDLPTGRLERLTDEGGSLFPSLSPDGRRLAYVHVAGALNVLDLETGEKTRLAPRQSAPFTPSWSPDGRFIAVAGKIWGTHAVFITRTDGGGLIMLTKEAARNMPAWSPDGRRITHITNDGGELRLTVVTGFEPYLERLMNPPGVHLFDRN
jgi:hypothetical protein